MYGGARRQKRKRPSQGGKPPARFGRVARTERAYPFLANGTKRPVGGGGGRVMDMMSTMNDMMRAKEGREADRFKMDMKRSEIGLQRDAIQLASLAQDLRAKQAANPGTTQAGQSVATSAGRSAGDFVGNVTGSSTAGQAADVLVNAATTHALNNPGATAAGANDFLRNIYTRLFN